MAAPPSAIPTTARRPNDPDPHPFHDRRRTAKAGTAPASASAHDITPGKRDGLYWPDDAQGESPLRPRFGGVAPGEGYHGYQYKILTAQGKDAPGGAYDYVIGGRMRAGFALVAWPIQYGDTGVTSFIISHEGVLYQKDLGPNSATIAREMNTFDPDPSWSKVNLP